MNEADKKRLQAAAEAAAKRQEESDKDAAAERTRKAQEQYDTLRKWQDVVAMLQRSAKEANAAVQPHAAISIERSSETSWVVIVARGSLASELNVALDGGKAVKFRTPSDNISHNFALTTQEICDEQVMLFAESFLAD